MLQLFRTFQVAGIFILLGFAALMRSAAWIVGAPPISKNVLNEWGLWLNEICLAGGTLEWIVGVVTIALIGFGACFSLQHYRLGAAGMLPGFIAVVLGSASWVWLGFSPLLFGAVLIAYAIHRLYQCYRHQGVSLPVFDAGILMGCAWLIAPSFLWFFPAAVLGLAQLRGFRFTDFFGMLIGVITPVVLVGVYHFMYDSLDSYLWIPSTNQWRLTQSLFTLPSTSEISSQWPWLLIMAIASTLTFIAVIQLTTRRPIQEQRFNRLIYNFLGAGWLAILFGGALQPWALAYVLFPLSVLLGIWLSELSRKQADIVSTFTLLLVVAGFLWSAIT